MTAPARTWFDLRLEHIRLAAMRVSEETSNAVRSDVLERILATIAAHEQAMHTFRQQHADIGLMRDEELANRIGLDDDELSLVWFCIAIASDPRLAPHAQLL